MQFTREIVDWNVSEATFSTESVRKFIGWGYVLIALLAMFSIVPFGVLVLALALLVIIDLIHALDAVPAIREVAGAIAVLQNVFGPYLLYTFFNEHQRYRMYVSASTYFPYAIPATCLFLLAMRLQIPVGTEQLRLPKKNTEGFKLGLFLVGVGLAASVLVRFGPGSLAFFFYLIANLRYVGAIYVYMSGHALRWPIVIVVVAGILLTSARQGMFHEMLLWGSLGGSYWFVGMRRPLYVKLAAIALAIVAIVVIQVVKPIYRNRLSLNANTSFVATARDVVDSDTFLSAGSMEQVVIRVSQGWIVSAAMRSVPSRKSFADGQTIRDAVYAALVPRIIAPGKKVASARANLNKYTSLRVGKKTQMGLGPLGESWINFGLAGGILTMFCFGLVINVMFRVMGRLSWLNEFFFYCLPVIFLQVVKAETEFLTIFNHITKSSFVIFVAYQGLRHVGLLTPKQQA